ncbi:L-rhamnose-binding lectin CSL3 [Hypomesus transpacificus]|uniref:L-rhamnose-binding lectin CSL3 n=1 Tax=Hypomesus transpacificus TaxID=137520 RepID=UPI001F075A42|nr:L-rhamnose-binding lectin CSL3 [Hypomesus transpacificus]
MSRNTLGPRLTLCALILLACCMSTGAVIICEGQRDFLNCGRSLIKVVSAHYGRRNRVTCSAGRPPSQISNINCINPIAYLLVAALCNGEQSCSLFASNSVFSDPCVGTYKYLDVTYVCVPRRTTVICEGQQATLNCGSSYIHVVSANYGRTDRVTCIAGRPPSQISNTNCLNPTTLVSVAGMCDGHASCFLSASNFLFSDPCVGTYKYLVVTYACL